LALARRAVCAHPGSPSPWPPPPGPRGGGGGGALETSGAAMPRGKEPLAAAGHLPAASDARRSGPGSGNRQRSEGTLNHWVRDHPELRQGRSGKPGRLRDERERLEVLRRRLRRPWREGRPHVQLREASNDPPPLQPPWTARESEAGAGGGLLHHAEADHRATWRGCGPVRHNCRVSLPAPRQAVRRQRGGLPSRAWPHLRRQDPDGGGPLERPETRPV